MKKEFFKISELLEKNSKSIRCWMWRRRINEIYTENITENVRGLEISKNNIQKCIAKGLQ